MPIPTDYTLDPGIDPTGTFGGYASVLLELVELAVPNSYHGWVIHSETAPAVTGQPTGYPTNWYAWHKRCIWKKPSTGEIFVYVSPSWVTPPVAAGSIPGASIIDGSVTIAKLSLGAGAAYQLIRINAAGTAYEFINPSSIFQAGTMSPTVLSGAGAGLVLGGATPSFVSVLSLLSDNTVPITKLLASTAKYLPRTNAAGTALEWAAISTIIEAGSIGLAKLTSAAVGDVGKVLTVQGDGTFAVQAASAGLTKTQYTCGPTAIPALSATPTPTTYTHGLSGVPQIVRAVWVCVTAENGYALNDELDFAALGYHGVGSSNDQYASVCTIKITSTDVTVFWASTVNWYSGPSLFCASPTTGINGCTPANWKLKIYLNYLA